MEGLQSITLGSMACKLKHSNKYQNRFIPSGMRKNISFFSKSSKRNMLWRIQTINYDKLKSSFWSCYFITLTYQKDFFIKNKNNKLAKIDLDKFFKRLNVFFNKNNLYSFTFWKMEFHKSGVPHFHLMFYLSSDSFKYQDMITIIPELWVDVITYKTKHTKKLRRKMLKVSTNVRYVNLEFEQIIQAYMSKEIGKEIQTDNINQQDYPGRFWGINNRKTYKEYVQEDTKLIPKKVYFVIRRTLKKLNRSKGYNYKLRGLNGFTSFYLNTKDIRRLLNYYEVIFNEISA